MIQKSEKLFKILFLLIPFFLITGPAIPDIIITSASIFGIFYLIYLKEYTNLNKINFFRISIIFWLSLITISLFSNNKLNSIQDALIFIRFLLIPIFCYYIFFKDIKIFEKALIIIFILTLFVCLDTLYQFFNYTSKNGFGEDLFGFKSNWYGRLTGPFKDELIPGSYVSKFGLFGFAFLISIKKIESKRILQSIYLAIILLVTYISGERMAFAIFSFGLLILFFALEGYKKTIFLSIIIGTLLIFFITYWHPFYNDYEIVESTQYHQGLKIEKFFECDNQSEEICSKIINIQPSFFEIIKNFSTSAYGEIYMLSFQMFLDNPITGIGLNNFKYLCDLDNTYNKMMKNFGCATHPHNIYLQWLSEGGLVVFIFFVIYLYYLILLIMNNDGEKKYKIISLIIILVMFWPIMSTGSLIKNWFGINTFYIIGLCMSLSRYRDN